MSIYNKLNKERKELQEKGELPSWITTPSYQLLKSKYLDDGETLKQRYTTIARILSYYIPKRLNRDLYETHFFNLMWDGFLAPSTPVLANVGRDKGCPVSCSGGYVGDSVYDFYSSQLEAAILSKNGFGISGYLGDIRERGASISGIRGGASGIVPVFKDFIQLSRDITQGSQRRGAWAGYVPIDHPDVDELLNFISKYPDDANIGWCIPNKFIDKLEKGDSAAIELYQKVLKLKMITGKGYFFFTDKVNNLKPKWYKDKDITIKASNLCTEIALPSNEEETFTCVLSSMNLRNYDLWERTDAVFYSTIFLHCVALHFIEVGSGIKGIEKAVEFTKNHMALGLGALGFHSYLQDRMIPFDSFEAYLINIEIFNHINKESLRASKFLASIFGEAPITEGYGVANSTRVAIAPNLSSALICGGVSQGIEPIYKNIYTQGSAGGEIHRINPSLLKILRERGEYNRQTLDRIIDDNGSVRNLDFLSSKEKEVFKTAFEISQFSIIKMASARQKSIDQAQSINLFFSADEDEDFISKVHKSAFLDPYIKSLYYIRSESGVMASKDECVSCHG